MTTPADIARRLAPGRPLRLAEAPEGFDGLFAADLAAELAPKSEDRAATLLFVARDGRRARDFAEAVAFARPEVETLHFP
ncbi:MAG: hypothetical protein KGQ28_06595, partial [Hyphomicrobiales bacterium]|nr:hypothetical protein [Hyphomicrobiales bacterium]